MSWVDTCLHLFRMAAVSCSLDQYQFIDSMDRCLLVYKHYQDSNPAINLLSILRIVLESTCRGYSIDTPLITYYLAHFFHSQPTIQPAEIHQPTGLQTTFSSQVRSIVLLACVNFPSHLTNREQVTNYCSILRTLV